MVAEGGEGENPLPFSLTAPKCAGGGGGGPQAPGGPGPGPGPQAPWRPGPQAPEAWIPPLSPVDFLRQDFVASQNHGSGSQNPRLLP